MKIQENVSLANYSTMRLGGLARYFVEITTETELAEALAYATREKLSIHILGGGSNTIFQDEGFRGLVISIKIRGIEVTEENNALHLLVGAGETWDDVVALSVEKGFSDIAALSLIPGTVGAAPIQNIGAYGQQVSDVLVSIRAFDTQSDSFVEIPQSECNFTYRHSRFNTTDAKRFIITNVKMQFSRKNIEPPFYADITRYFAEHNIDEQQVTPALLRKAVSTVRVVKLPDPAQIASCGSFFKNPVVDSNVFQKLIEQFPELKSHRTDDQTLKLYAGQLIELCGLKDYHDPKTGMATWKNQALVLVNESANTTSDLLTFKQEVVAKVQETFGITLQQEPELVAA